MMPAREGAGRPCGMTYGVLDHIEHMVQEGVPPVVACQALNIPRDTYNMWMKHGRNGKSRVDTTQPSYSEFHTRINKALALFQTKLANKWAKIVSQPHTKKVTREKFIDVGGKLVPYNEVTITEDGAGDWRGIQAYLRAIGDPTWNTKDTVEHVGPNGGPIQAVLTPIPLDRLSVELRQAIILELEGSNSHSLHDLSNDTQEKIASALTSKSDDVIIDTVAVDLDNVAKWLDVVD